LVFLVGLIEKPNNQYLTFNLHTQQLKENIKINQPAGAGAPFSFGEGLGMRDNLPVQGHP